MSDTPHKNHRERLRQRFARSGFDGFSEHEIVELLLFYVIPRKNTNEIAHALVNRFGNLRGILSASTEQLCRIPGIAQQSALFLQLLRNVYGRLQQQSAEGGPCYRTVADILPLARGFYADKRNEQPLLLLLDARYHKIKLIPMKEGTLTAGQIAVHDVTHALFSHDAAFFVLIHNHPDGSITPSQSDLFLTNQWRYLFQTLGCPMLEHLIVTEDDCYPILEREYKLSGLLTEADNEQ